MCNPFPHEFEADMAFVDDHEIRGRVSAPLQRLHAGDLHRSCPIGFLVVRLDHPDEDNPGQRQAVVGVTVPGGPGIVVGSNGRIAWGFTNTQGDWSDLVELEIEDVVGPAGERARGLAHVAFAVVADAHREELEQFTAEVFVRMAFDVLAVVEIDEHCRILEDPATCERARRALRDKYGWQMWLLDAGSKISGRFGRRAYLALRVTNEG